MFLPFFLAAIASLALLLPGNAQSQESSSCSSYANCNKLGVAALQDKRWDDAIQLFQRQAGWAELDGSELSVYTAYNNLAVANLDKHDYLMARFWALLVLSHDKNNQAAQFNLRKIEQGLQGWQWPPTPTGEYVQYAGGGLRQSMIIDSEKSGSLHFCFSGLYWGRASMQYGPTGMGELRATVPLKDNRAEYVAPAKENGACRISLHFSPDKLEIEQTGSDFDCGFGHNVTADGTFQRISASAKCPPENQ